MYSKGMVVSFIAMLTCLPAENPSEEHHFEPATLEDAPSLMTLARESHDSYQTCLNRIPTTLPPELFETGIVETLQSNQQTIGFYTLQPKKHMEDSAELCYFFIKQEEQGKGFGRTLFQRMIQHATYHGYKQVTWVSDPHAEGFYEKMGATLYGYYDCAHNKQLMLPVFTYPLETYAEDKSAEMIQKKS